VNFKISLFAFLIFTIVMSSIPYRAFGDGFTQENLPPASVGNRNVQLFIKLSPPIITSDLTTPRYIYMRLFDANTNETIVHDSFFISVTKHNQLLLRDLFHTHTGELTLEITPTKTPGKWTIYGDQEPFLNAWLNQGGGPIPVLADVLGEGGLYHLHVELFSIDYDKNIFTPDQAPKWDAYLSVGDISNHNITYNNNDYNTTLISYYDKINDFKFDPSTKQFTWTMPFDWNTTRFQNRPIFIHEELHVPKSFKDFANTPTYKATAQGFELTGRRIIVDPYTVGDTMIVHLFLNKFDIQNIAKNVPPGTSDITFTVAPQPPNVKTSASLLTDFGGWHINLGWNPTSLTGNSQNNLKLTFYDAFTENQVQGNVDYDIQLLDSAGNVLWSKNHATANGGTDTQQINLPGNGIYGITVKVNSISTNGIADTSRQGIGRGNVVIPSTVAASQDTLIQTNSTGSSTQTSGGTQTTKIVIPSWIKNNAKWWHDGSIGDPDFVKGLQYMIQNGIVVVPPSQGTSSGSQVIPAWIKNDAGWWADGTIDDKTFVQAIQYMITNGIITLQT
jgi:hypothetical protein